MLKLILAAVLLLLLCVGGLAVTLFHFWGWKGMVAFPFVLIVMIWAGKAVFTTIVKRLALGLFSVKAGALRDATMSIHSITPVPKPLDNPLPQEQASDGDEEVEDEEQEPDADEEPEPEPGDDDEEKPREYYAVELTITPAEKCRERFWEPGEFILASDKIKSIEDLETKEVGSVEDLRVWDGKDFGPDEQGKYPGSQRLKITFAVRPGTSQAWLQYYNQAIGSLELPRWELGGKALERGR